MALRRIMIPILNVFPLANAPRPLAALGPTTTNRAVDLLVFPDHRPWSRPRTDPLRHGQNAQSRKAITQRQRFYRIFRST